MKKYWVFGALFLLGWAVSLVVGTEKPESPITQTVVEETQKIIGMEFSQSERDSMLDDLKENLESYQKIRNVEIANSIPPSLQFNPIPVGAKCDERRKPLVVSAPKSTKLPRNIDEISFYSVRDLAELLRKRKISSVELTRMYIERLKKYGPKLECVITITEDLALEQARRADAEIAEGKYRGYLHGIPYGAKDLLAVKGYETTWGAVPYKDQVIDENATIIKKLEEAGAVLAAKLTLGALAWGDVWYGGKTRNPWNLEQGSSGSSAGSASATAAGLVAFSIGTETWGSIVSPSTRCGTTGMRPTYGRVSRTGAMALSWSMDKIGPICRSVEDCALVFDAIVGPDGVDQTLMDIPFNYNHAIDLKSLRIGYLEKLFEAEYADSATDAATLEKLKELGANLIPVDLPEYPVEALAFILSAEAAAAFDDLTRSGRDDLMVRQIKNAWPNVFRSSRLIPAVEYIQANRVRYMIIQEMQRLFDKIDVYVAPSFGGNNLLLTNLTGHPCVVLPNGFDEEGRPVSISFIGKLYDEATLLAVAKVYQDATGFDKMHPPLFQ
ncbi:MAG: amidase [Candidatus Latescibacteria bacterium]|nr:amidase [Candidatus Latescibacterota bacterium]NIM21442.1 amidase [Candidatus Latescibacterota bacterium]NIM65623.1 amidase [Candidatus Latescibacterota bacterium]NIO02004.1 amidase [Candidatus Latescibacterota bacterium]NIO28816.1 amidase [Candidatus Latescibacterota bacterium]